MTMGWKYEEIAEMRRSRVSDRFKDASREELLARIVDLETQLYPFFVALAPITEKPWQGTSVSSKLFPMRPDEDEDAFYVFNKETREGETVRLDEKQLSSVDYYTADGLVIMDGANLADNFEIISFHQSAPACYIGNGSIFVGDVRRLIEVFNAPYRKDAITEAAA